MEYQSLVGYGGSSPCDFPPTWDDFQAARQRFLDRARTDDTHDGGGGDAEVRVEPDPSRARSRHGQR